MNIVLLIILMAGVHRAYGSCNFGHLFQPVSSEGMPCHPSNLDCIRIFFVNTWMCLEQEGLLPVLSNITEFDFPAPTSGMSTTAYGLQIKGIRSGRGIQMYLRTIDTLVISTEWPRIDIHCERVVIHRPGMKDVAVTDLDIRFDYVLILGTFISSEITISRNVQTFVEKVHQPVFHYDAGQSAEELNRLFRILLQDVSLMIQKLFVVRGDSFMKFLIKNGLCRPSGFLNSSASICGPVSRQRRDMLDNNNSMLEKKNSMLEKNNSTVTSL